MADDDTTRPREDADRRRTDADDSSIASAAALSMAELYLATAQALANAAHQATLAQQQNQMIQQAATAKAVHMILGIGSGDSRKADG